MVDTATNSVATTINVGNDPDWVTVNPAGTRAYVTNSSDDTVSVIDLNTNAVTATISVGNQPNGVAVNPSGTRAYVSTSQGVSVIDTATNAASTPIDIAYLAPGIAATESYAYATVSYNGAKVVVIDSSTNAVTATISVGPDYLRGIAVDPNGTRAYVVDGYKNLSVINTTTKYGHRDL